jgi:glycosyltransferase involved in cell wall biosynthesis
MKIAFLLPSAGTFPVGGFKIVYQLADGLAGRGYEVTVVHPSSFSTDPLSIGAQLHRSVFRYAKRALLGTWKPSAWVKFRNNVRLLWVPALNRMFLPKADVFVATWWVTAERLASWKDIKGLRLYYLQSVEMWGGPKERVLATYRSDLKMIAISRWIQEFVRDLGNEAVYIPYGLDFESFDQDCDMSVRNPSRIAMLFHNADLKGSIDGINAMKIAKELVPDLTAELFGLPDRPADLPEWIHYHQNPPQTELRRLYNRAAVFVSPSLIEGRALPPAEAMMCGTAVAATDIGGHRDFCVDGLTALLAPPKNPAELAERIVRLVQDSALRTRIAKQGHEYVKQFTWEKTLNAFEEIL